MGMQFTVAITGDVKFEGLDASDIGIEADAVLSAEVGWSSNVSFEDAQVVSGEVTIEARARYEDYEVSPQDLADFDADTALNEAIDSYNAEVSNADFEVTDSPTGFDVVEAATDRDTAIAVYAALAEAGHEVS